MPSGPSWSAASTTSCSAATSQTAASSCTCRPSRRPSGWATANSGPGSKKACPRLLGALFDAVAGGIRLWPEVRLPELSRMADVDRWGESVARALGHPPGTFIAAYRANRKSACQRVLEDVPIFAALSKALDTSGLIEGTPTEVLLRLTDHLPFKQSAQSGWPRSPVAFSRLLHRMTPQLRAIGIIVRFHRGYHGRIITIVRNDVTETALPEPVATTIREQDHNRSWPSPSSPT